MIRFLFQQFSRVPFWIKLPLIIMEVSVIIFLVSWIYLTRSVDTVEVPDLVGKSKIISKKLLERRNLDSRIIKRNSNQTPEDQVIRQRPPSGSLVKEYRNIELFISQGPKYTKVPDLTEKTVLRARNIILKKGNEKSKQGQILNLGSIARVHSEEQSKGQILLQNPRPGQNVIRGTQVDLLISKGPWPERSMIPSVKGKSVDEAKKILRESNFTVGSLNYRYNPDKSSSIILSQTPPSGRLIREGSPISIIANLSQNQTRIPLRYTTLRIITPLGLEPGVLLVKLIDRRGRKTIFNQKVSPGKKVELMVSVKGKAKVIIYWNGDIHRFWRIKPNEEAVSINPIR